MQQVLRNAHDGDEDSDLVRRAVAGDRRAFAVLYAKHRGLVTARVRQLALPSTVDDLVQDTFLRAFVSLRGYRAEGAFPGWLLAIATRLTQSDRRRTQRAPWRLFVTPEEEARSEPTTDAGPSPDRVALRAALDRLSPRLREAVVLADVEEHTLADIATRLHAPLQTVAARVRRGRARLRQQLVALRAIGLLLATTALLGAAAWAWSQLHRPAQAPSSLPSVDPPQVERPWRGRVVPHGAAPARRPTRARPVPTTPTATPRGVEPDEPLGDVIFGQAPRRQAPLFSTAEYRARGVLVGPND